MVSPGQSPYVTNLEEERRTNRSFISYHPVHNVVTTKDNTALLQCHVPSVVRQFVSVESWSRSDGVVYRQNHSDDNVRVLQTGEMLVYNVVNDNTQYTYMCKAKHRLTGYIATSATYGKLTIQEPHGPSSPRFVLKCSSVKVLEGQQSELPCVTEGWPVPTVRWYKEYNGKLESLPATERVSSDHGILTIRDTERYDEGLYVCITNNSVEEKREKTILKVTSRLKIMVIPKVQVVQIGGAAVLNCTINGFPINAITWLKNERPLVVNSRISYLSKTVMKISSVVRSDSGMYQCFIFNNDESGQGTSELTIRDVAPILASSFPETTVHPGTSVSLMCTATANPIPNIAWFVDKQPLHDTYRISLSSHLFVEDSVVGQLNLTDTRVEDGGRYTCVSSNGVGSVEHSNRLNVYGPPFIRPMWNMTVVSDHTLVLRCPFGGFPVERITWERGRILLPLSHREEVGEDGTLTIRGVHKQVDEGKYTCTVQNSEGQIASGSTFISVVVAPVIDDNFFPDKVTVTEGMTARLYCSVAEGEPPIKIHWVKDGEILMTKGHVNVDNSQEYSVVVFKHVTARDNGKYTHCLQQCSLC
ncbi:cell adhesion molecule Dscam1-like [Tachypleus tridentatus]|uniref:cell adhesion molecule Dscam1-like n=1 Tax=Tachypleus tridentatus TaxID=6853 RepID=UPI003FD0F8BD